MLAHYSITSLSRYTVDSRYLELGISETRSVFLNLEYILIAFSNNNLALETFLQVQITRSANQFALRLIWTCKKIVTTTLRYRELTVHVHVQVSTKCFRDHAFDRYLRRRKKRKSKKADISKLHEVARGCLPVRQHHKCDESKILPTTRLGIDLKYSTEHK